MTRAALGGLVATFVLTVTAAVGAQPTVAADLRSSVYLDSDDTVISTSTVAVRATALELLTFKGRYLADVISSASVDVVSAATESFFEVRHEAEGGVGYADGTTTANVTYIYSSENDWRSHTFAAGFSQDFFQHQLTLGLGGALVLNDIGRQDDDNFTRKLTNGSITASATIVASPDDLVSMAYSFTYADGYQSSPYRFVFLRDPNGTPLPLGPVEVHPDTRVRHAAAMRYNRYLFRNSSLRSHVRVYLDDWGVASITFGTEYTIGFPPIELGARVRGYVQSKAAFYQSLYEEPRRYMTADRELGGFFDAFGGLRFGWRERYTGAIDSLRVEARVDGFGFRFFDFPRLKDRFGLTAELGVGATF